MEGEGGGAVGERGVRIELKVYHPVLMIVLCTVKLIIR